MSDDNPVPILCSSEKLNRHRIARAPQLHGVIVDGVAATENLSGWVSRVALRTDNLQDRLAACFIITMQNMRRGGRCSIGKEMLW
jgi:hypothetical protein